MSKRACNRCTASKINGSRCTKRTCKYGPYCWIHTRTKLYLKVGPSTIKKAGMGLFVDKPGAEEGELVFGPNIDAGTGFGKGKICHYNESEPISQLKLERRWGPSDNTLAKYALRVGDGKYRDAYKTNDGVGRYTNDCHNTKKRCNAKFTVSPRYQTAYIAAEKKIYNKQEILISYGTGYWKSKNKNAKDKRRKTKNSNK
jgi:hypothetical protein